MKDLKGPNQKPDTTRRAEQLEEPARVYVDLATGKVCADGFEELPNNAQEDPGVRIVTERLSNTSAKPTMVGTN